MFAAIRRERERGRNKSSSVAYLLVDTNPVKIMKMYTHKLEVNNGLSAGELPS